MNTTVARSTADSASDRRWDVIIVGAGMSGIGCRSHLLETGLSVLTLEKSRGLGGRMATRRWTRDEQPLLADLGAQDFSLRSESLREQLASVHLQANVATTPLARPRYVHPEGMSRVARAVARDLASREAPVETGKRVQSFRADSADPNSLGWEVVCETGERYRTRSLVLSAPVPQAWTLIQTAGIALDRDTEAKLSACEYRPCIAGIFETDETLIENVPALIRRESSSLAPELDGIFEQRKKGLHTARPVFVVHASAEWSAKIWEYEEAAILEILWHATLQSLGRAKASAPIPTHSSIHRWRLGEPRTPIGGQCLEIQTPAPLLLCGDAFTAARVESAYESGVAAAKRIALKIAPRIP